MGMRLLGMRLAFAAIAFLACLPAAHAQSPAPFDCRADDGHCPELVIAGDPPYEIPGYGLSPFRGYADPSFRTDPKTGALWLSYSWVSLFPVPGGQPGKPIIDVGVSVHLARSTDGGKTFARVANIWKAEPQTYEKTQGYSGHEVSTLAPTLSGWAELALRYFNPRGDGNDFRPNSFNFEMREAADPEKLADAPVMRLGGPLTGKDWRPFTDLSAVAGVGLACPVWTEPSLFSDGPALYLLAQCKTPANPAKGYLALFVREASGWRSLGALTTPADAAALGGNELTQADLARSRDGSVLLIVTPNVVKGKDEHHLGCTVLGVASLDKPQLRRSPDGALDIRVRIVSSDSAQNGPGACAYDPASSTGVLLTRRIFSKEKGIVFSIHATGLHP